MPDTLELAANPMLSLMLPLPPALDGHEAMLLEDACVRWRGTKPLRILRS